MSTSTKHIRPVPDFAPTTAAGGIELLESREHGLVVRATEHNRTLSDAQKSRAFASKALDEVTQDLAQLREIARDMAASLRIADATNSNVHYWGHTSLEGRRDKTHREDAQAVLNRYAEYCKVR